jgi:hypothetical protein
MAKRSTRAVAAKSAPPPRSQATNAPRAASSAEGPTGTETPLDYMLRIMRDPTQDDDRRDGMAKAALPYMHSRLSSVDGQVSDNEGGTITFTWQPAQK